jgi:hypothetical protein
VLVARHHPGRHGEKIIPAAVGVNQTHQLVTAVPLIALVFQINLFRIDRMIVFVEQELDRALVILIVGDEQIGAVADE